MPSLLQRERKNKFENDEHPAQMKVRGNLKALNPHLRYLYLRSIKPYKLGVGVKEGSIPTLSTEMVGEIIVTDAYVFISFF